MGVKEFLKETYGVTEGGYVHKDRGVVVCGDGYRMKICAGQPHNSDPRENLPDGDYKSVEIRNPSNCHDRVLLPYGRWPRFSYVPVELVDMILAWHGGIKEILEDN